MKRSIAYFLLATMASAQFTILTPAPASAAPVRFAGRDIINIDAAAGGLSAFERAEKIQHNIENSLVAANDRGPTSVQIVYVKGQPVITLGGFYVATVDAASAKAAGTTPTLLANRWAGSLKQALTDRKSVDQYVAQLTGTNSGITVGTADTHTGASYPYYQQGRVVYIPAGMTLPVKLTSSLTSAAAKPGDVIEAQLAETVVLGDATIPVNSVIRGQVTEAVSGNRMSKSGTLGMKFVSIRTPDGAETPINAHIVGGIGRYQDKGGTQADIFKGEDGKDKIKRALVSGAIGAGSGAVLGTAIGGIAGRGRGAGRGAWSGLAIGAGLGVAESLLLRKGNEVNLAQGATLKLQLDSPASLSVNTLASM